MMLTEKRVLAFILLSYLALAALYSIITPIFEASDELWHYPMVQTIASTGQLPVQDPASIGPWRQEGSQPPLYYILTALLTAGIDTSDMGYIRRQNPHADIGVVLPDRNVNMITHHAELEIFPWRGTVLALHMARFFSVFLGLGTVYVTYLLGREIFPTEPVIRLGAAGFVAYLPMFLFISGSVNNDNLSNFTGSLLLLLIVRLVRLERLPHWRDYILLGITAGVGLLAKLNIGFLLPLAALTLFISSLRHKNWHPFVVGGLISGTLTILIAGWWYLRNLQLYGDPTGLNVFLEIVGRRLVPANLAQLWSERHSFTQAYWGFFGGMNVPLPDMIYRIFNIIGMLGLIGAAAFIIHALLRRNSSLLPPQSRIAAIFSFLWPLMTFLSYLRWTAETPASQGRLVFGAISAISLWMTVGLVWWLPHRVRPAVMTGIAALFAFVAAAAPFLVIAPAYQEPPVPAEIGPTIATFSSNTAPGSIQLLQAEIRQESTEVYPETFVLLDTVWEIGQPLDRDWSLFVHLVTPDGVILSQRDVYPAQGLLATSDLAAGRRWSSPIAVWIPPAAYAPMRLDVHIGWYHLPTGERLTLDDGEEFYAVGHVELLPRISDLSVPNPLSVNFGGLIELVGYELSDLSPAAGDLLNVTLYWRGLRQITEDYKVFVNVIDPPTLAKYAASDAMPVQWQRPTSTWQPGEIIVDQHEMTVDLNAPPGIYELQVGLYREKGDILERLRIFTPDGGQAHDLIYLSRVRVLPAPEDQ
jgi:4-amino-4-deoxy-L-arabinose transferase-like glycosyltransferase